MSKAHRRLTLLPPPVETILFYAADGLASERKQLSRNNKPRTPERAQWVPLFRRLIETTDGMARLKDLATTGLRAWNCPASLIDCLDPAFRDVTFRVRAAASLDHLAASAREGIALAQPTKTPTQARPETPQAQTQHHSQIRPAERLPQRPSGRSKTKPPTP